MSGRGSRLRGPFTPCAARCTGLGSTRGYGAQRIGPAGLVGESHVKRRAPLLLRAAGMAVTTIPARSLQRRLTAGTPFRNPTAFACLRASRNPKSDARVGRVPVVSRRRPWARETLHLARAVAGLPRPVQGLRVVNRRAAGATAAPRNPPELSGAAAGVPCGAGGCGALPPIAVIGPVSRALRWRRIGFGSDVPNRVASCRTSLRVRPGPCERRRLGRVALHAELVVGRLG